MAAMKPALIAPMPGTGRNAAAATPHVTPVDQWTTLLVSAAALSGNSTLTALAAIRPTCAGAGASSKVAIPFPSSQSVNEVVLPSSRWRLNHSRSMATVPATPAIRPVRISRLSRCAMDQIVGLDELVARHTEIQLHDLYVLRPEHLTDHRKEARP